MTGATVAPTPKRWGAAYENGDCLWVLTYSGYRAALFDGDAQPHELSLTASDADVGKAILVALTASRFMNPIENPRFFDVRGRAVPDYNNWVKSVIEGRSYKNRRAMFKTMKYCAIEAEGARIAMRPTTHERLEGWSGDGMGPDHHVVINAEAGASAVGAALRLALSRCK